MNGISQPEEKKRKPGSAGIVETKTVRLALPPEGFALENGEHLLQLDVAYETYGQLNPVRDNVIFICHALSGDAHVAGYHHAADSKPGWWDEMVGPGKGIDTDHYHIICANILGGCKGTTGPSSINPKTGKPYGSSFPNIAVTDIVHVHRLLLQELGIQRLAAVIGGSFGGMQALEWSLLFPEMIDRCVCIASAGCLSAQALAFDIIGRKAITTDPDWQGGDYYGTGRLPRHGLAHARKLGHITYLSPEMMQEKFGREKRQAPAEGPTAREFRSEFQVESYLDYQGEKFVERFDANSYLHITQAMDEYDLITRHGSLEKAFAPITAKILVVALSSDWLFPPEQSEQIANALLRARKRVSYCQLHAPHGHDAFLVDIEHLSEVIHAFLPWVSAPAKAGADPEKPTAPNGKPCECGRTEFDIVREFVKPGARVLDVGCGDGSLLSLLARDHNISGIGVDFDIEHVIDVIDKGHDVFQADIDAGLAMIPDSTYDYAILSETLQVVRKPRLVLDELLRVARKGIVSFPNFGKWSHRLRLCAAGRMPKGDALPFEWYATPNIHLFTLKDFMALCRKDGIRILNLVCLPSGKISRLLVRLGFCNLGADRVLVKITRQTGDTPDHCRCVPCNRKEP